MNISTNDHNSTINNLISNYFITKDIVAQQDKNIFIFLLMLIPFYAVFGWFHPFESQIYLLHYITSVFSACGGLFIACLIVNTPLFRLFYLFPPFKQQRNKFITAKDELLSFILTERKTPSFRSGM